MNIRNTYQHQSISLDPKRFEMTFLCPIENLGGASFVNWTRGAEKGKWLRYKYLCT